MARIITEPHPIAEGFVTASLLFCVGAMAILGSFNAGLKQDYELLFTKSLLDGISSCMLTLVSLPLSVCFLSSTWRFINNLPCDDTPRWWMGPMGNWNEYVKAGVDWFLFRWLMARNINTFFCLVVIIVFIINSIVK